MKKLLNYDNITVVKYSAVVGLLTIFNSVFFIGIVLYNNTYYYNINITFT